MQNNKSASQLGLKELTRAINFSSHSSELLCRRRERKRSNKFGEGGSRKCPENPGRVEVCTVINVRIGYIELAIALGIDAELILEIRIL